MAFAFPKYRLLDLSVSLKNNPHTDPPNLGPQIEYRDHKQGLKEMLAMFPGLKAEDLPDGEAWGTERLTMTAHNGTHIDAPWHFASTQDGGKPAWTIDELPLDWCFRPAVKLDFRHLPDGYVATAGDIEAELKRIGHDPQPLEIVVVNTAAGAKYGQPKAISIPGVASAGKALCICWSAACGYRHRRLELGRALLIHAQALGRAAMRASSGRDTRPAATSATARSKSSPISTSFPPTVSGSRASHTRLSAARQGFIRAVAFLPI